jgi:NADH-quinone oxidoreductase subunit L
MLLAQNTAAVPLSEVLGQYAATASSLATLLAIAWLLPLAGFAIEIFAGYWGERKSKAAAYMAIGCIATGFLCSSAALVKWLGATAEARHAHAAAHEPHAATDDHKEAHAAAGHDAHDDHSHANNPFATGFSGTYYELANIGGQSIKIDYYIDGLTVAMFTMVTLIATCIHIFATGYMSDELTDHYEDHQVHLSGGRHFHRPGRFYRFFAFLSLFCFSMLGLVIAGNIFQVFVFWELVGVCSYFLIGFYVERKSASNAANKAFIMNRVGDFGFLIGLMVLWTYFGTFQFANTDKSIAGQPGLFQMVRTEAGQIDVEGEGRSAIVHLQSGHGGRWTDPNSKEPKTIPYWLLVVAGLGIFAGCIGKSAQFPLQTWLPDAMEGPTPVSALVHSATMVAAGVYLAGRFYPMFTPEVLLTIAYIGCITLFVGATIAIVATDIKKVLAYSTISQLGYMMLALGVGGWVAGLFHLITHAFFKSLMFLCSGSVIHGCHHEQEMTKMGGLLKKMPITAITMLIGVIAIAGLAIPGTPIAFSGYHSKDAIVASSLSFFSLNPKHSLLFMMPLVTAGITAFYMFRLWFMTFLGKPRDQHVYDHAHESPWVMTVPLMVLSFFAMFCAIGGEAGPLGSLLLTAEPAHVAPGIANASDLALSYPSHGHIHEKHATAGTLALLAALAGTTISYLFYGMGLLDANGIRKAFPGIYTFLQEKWQFDSLYDTMFVRPTHIVSRWATAFDKHVLDAAIHRASAFVISVATVDRYFDEKVVDRIVNIFGDVTQSLGNSIKNVQTGRLRQYVTFIALGVVSLFLLMFAFLPRH